MAMTGCVVESKVFELLVNSSNKSLWIVLLVELLNEYLTAMTQIILDNGGTIDKYIGDAIVAFYGAPVDVKDHENKAILTVFQMKVTSGETLKLISLSGFALISTSTFCIFFSIATLLSISTKTS